MWREFWRVCENVGRRLGTPSARAWLRCARYFDRRALLSLDNVGDSVVAAGIRDSIMAINMDTAHMRETCAKDARAIMDMSRI